MVVGLDDLLSKSGRVINSVVGLVLLCIVVCSLRRTVDVCVNVASVSGKCCEVLVDAFIYVGFTGGVSGRATIFDDQESGVSRCC